MKSRISIEIDFDNGNKPVIQIIQKSSEDVRDNLVHYFIELLGHQSTLCKITYDGEFSAPYEPFKRWKISPISPEQMPEELKAMQSFISLNEVSK